MGRKAKTLPKYLDKTAIQTIIDNANHDTNKHGRRNHLLLLVLWRTGIRAEEVSKLAKKDIHEDTLTIRQGKGRKDRVVPLGSDLRNLLLVYSDQLKSEDRLFDMTARQLRNIVRKYTPDELSWVHPHTFRHSFAVFCINHGMNIIALARILGHTSIQTTQIYLQLTLKDIKDEYKKLPW